MNNSMSLEKIGKVYIVAYALLFVLELVRVLVSERIYLEVPLKLLISLSCLFIVLIPKENSQTEFSFRDRFLLRIVFVFIFLGDIMLAGFNSVLHQTGFFEVGLVFFAFAHLFLITRHFLRLQDFKQMNWTGWKLMQFVISSLAVILFAIFIRKFVAVKLSVNLLFPLTLYLVILSISFITAILMFLFKFYKRSFWLMLGVGLFYFSDLMIGLSLVVKEWVYEIVSWSIWMLYAPGIVFIAFSGSAVIEDLDLGK